MEQSLDSFLKNVLQDDEMLEKTKELCRNNFIKDVKTLFELTPNELQSDLKFPFIVVKKLTPHLKASVQAADVDQVNQTIKEIKGYKSKLNNTEKELKVQVLTTSQQIEKLKQLQNLELKKIEELNKNLVQISESQTKIETIEKYSLAELGQNYQQIVQCLNNLKSIFANVSKYIEGQFLQESILVKTLGEKNLIKQWLPKLQCQTKLLYRSSTDENSSKQFHLKCDNKGPTLCIVKVKDETYQIVGGYAAQAWQSSGGHQPDETLQSFVFNLQNQQKQALKKANDAFLYQHNYDPCFEGTGNHSILGIVPYSNGSTCSKIYSQYGNGNSFEEVKNSQKKQESLVNNYDHGNTQYTDYEVYQVFT